MLLKRFKAIGCYNPISYTAEPCNSLGDSSNSPVRYKNKKAPLFKVGLLKLYSSGNKSPMSCPALSCLVLSCFVQDLSCPVLSCPVLLCPAVDIKKADTV